MITGVERRRLLARMGVAVFVPRGAAATATATATVAVSGPAGFAAEAAGSSAPAGLAGAVARGVPDAADGADAPVSGLAWPGLEAAVERCIACPLHLSRANTVFGTGAREADWMVIGEAPGANEDRRGEPFVGRAGRLLNAMLHAIGLAREEVFITNAVKCRPPQNRDPHPVETERCGPFLDRQVELLSPRVILVAGRIAAQTILGSDAPLARLRGREHSLSRGGRRVPVVATYHPAYLLRRPIAKRAAWEDLCLARSIAARSR